MMKTQKDIFLAFSERLKFLREENQFTQKELSDRLKMLNYNISEDMISAFERGISEPKLSQIHAFCILFKVDPNFILGYTQSPDSGQYTTQYQIKLHLREIGISQQQVEDAKKVMNKLFDSVVTHDEN